MTDPQLNTDDFLALRAKHWDFLFDHTMELTHDPIAASLVMDETFRYVFLAWHSYAKNPGLDVKWWLGAIAENVHKNLTKYCPPNPETPS